MSSSGCWGWVNIKHTGSGGGPCPPYIVYSVSGSSSQTQQYGVWAQAYVQPSTWKCDIWCNMTIKTVIKYVTMHWWKKIDAVKEHCAEWKTRFFFFYNCRQSNLCSRVMGLSHFKNGFSLRRPPEQVAFCSNIKSGQWCLASGKCLIIQLLNFL